MNCFFFQIISLSVKHGNMDDAKTEDFPVQILSSNIMFNDNYHNCFNGSEFENNFHRRLHQSTRQYE